MTTKSIYTESEIQQHVADYADHYNVANVAVDVCRNYDGDGQVIGFRLSLDFGGCSRGCDEMYGEWK